MLDPIGRRDVFSLARRLNLEEGITVVWITHFMEEAALADRLVVMDGGRIALQGSPRRCSPGRSRCSRWGWMCPR